jgi:hypothetical protein
MALKAVVDDIDTVDEAKRDLYVEREGKFVLDVDESFRAHPQVVGLKNTLEKFKGYLNTVKDVLNGTEVDITKMDGVLKPVLARIKEVREEKPEGYDPEELERLRTELAAREKDPENKELRQRLEAQFAQSRADDAKKTAAELKRRDIKDAEKDEIISGFQTKFRNGIIDKALDDAADAASVKPALRKAFKAQMREEAGLEIEEGDEGRPTVKVKLALGGDPAHEDLEACQAFALVRRPECIPPQPVRTLPADDAARRSGSTPRPPATHGPASERLPEHFAPPRGHPTNRP